MRRQDTKKTLVKGGVPLMDIIELEAALQAGGLLKAEKQEEKRHE